MKLYILTALLLISAMFTNAQWVTNGLELSPTSDYNYNPQLTMSNNNSTWEVWRAQDTTVDEAGAIYLTGYDKSGDPLSGFNSGAIAISDSSDCYMPQLIISSDSDIIVTWYAYPDSSYNIAEVYIQKFTPAGVALWNHGNAVLVSAADSTQNKFPVMASDKNGGAYICWQRSDYNIDPSTFNVLLQRLDSGGHVASGWSATPVIIGAVLDYNQWYPKIAVTPAGDAVYVQYYRGLITDLSLWLVRINAANGTPATAFSTGSGVLISFGPNLSPFFLVDNFILCDSAGDALSVWAEYRVSANGEIYYQKTTAGGSQSFTYGYGKLIEGNSAAGYDYLYASLDDDGNILAAWNDYVVNYDVGCAKFKPDGTIIWPSAYTPITTNNNSAYPKIVPDHEGGSYIFYEDVTNYPSTLYCLRLDSAGKVLWSLPGLLEGFVDNEDGFDPQFDFQVTNTDSVQTNTTWNYQPSALFNIYACYALPSGQSCSDSVSIPDAVPVINAPSSGIVVSPNPSKNQFTISISGAASSQSLQFKLYNEMGMLVLNQYIKESTVIQTSSLAAGFYFGKIIDEQGNCLDVKKIIVQR